MPKCYFKLWTGLVCVSICASAIAQESTTGEADKLIQNIYAKTSSAESAKDFTEIIEACRDAQSGTLSQDTSRYLSSLMSWAHNRRGEKRAQLIDQLSKAGNEPQAAEVKKLAEEDFAAALQHDPTRWRAHLNLGLLHVQAQQYQPAIDDFGRVVELQPDNGIGWFNRAEVRYRTAQYDQAIEDYQRAIAINEGDLQAITGRGHCYLRLGKLEQALADYDVVLKLQPQIAQAWANRGDAYHQLARWEDADADYRKSLELAPLGGVFRRAAWMLATCPDMEHFRPQLALDLARKAIEMDGDNWANLDALAAALAANGDFEAARKAQTRAIELAENRPELQERLSLYDNHKAYQQSSRAP